MARQNSGPDNNKNPLDGLHSPKEPTTGGDPTSDEHRSATENSPLIELDFDYLKADKVTTEVKDSINQTVAENGTATAAKTIFLSPTPWSSGSNVVFCIGVSYIGLIGHILSGVWSLKNEVSAKFRDSESPQEISSMDTPTYPGLLKHLFLSPAASRIFQTGVYALSVLEAPFHGRIGEAIAFASWLVGVAAAAFEMNRGYGGAEFQKLGVVQSLNDSWEKLPKWTQRLLTSPGITFCLGDLIYSVNKLDLPALVAAWPSPASIATGLGLLASATGIFFGIKGAFSATESKTEKSLPLYCAALDCGFYGLAQFLSGNILAGVGFHLGFISNVLFGVRTWLARK